MTENSNENIKKKSSLEVNVGDELRVDDVTEVTVIHSDLSVTVPKPTGQKEELVFGEGWTTDMVIDWLRKVTRIPLDDPEWPGFKSSVQQKIEVIREGGWVGTGKLPFPTGPLKHLGFPEEVSPEITFQGGEKTTITVITTLKPEGSSQGTEGEHL